MLRSGVPAASRNACTCWATGDPSPPEYAAASNAMPINSMVINRPRAGIERIANPASPAAATNVVASTATDPVTNDAPAVALGATNGVQL